MSGPDTSKPVPTPPHFRAQCDSCGWWMESDKVSIYPGSKPWTFLCERDRGR